MCNTEVCIDLCVTLHWNSWCFGDRVSKTLTLVNIIKQPCADGSISFYSKQCSAYDEQPFHGSFYKWIPIHRAQKQ